MSVKSLRILVSGDVEGRFDQLFSRINSIQKKSGSFDLLLCVGNFFGDSNAEWEKYSSGSTKVPLPVLILGPNKPEHVDLYKDMKGGDLCENVTYLGKKGYYTGSSGLQLAYLSGTESDIVSDSTNFNAVDITALTDPVKNDSKFKGVDILITSQWPKGVEKYGTELEGFSSSDCGSETLSQLAIKLRPRYHFCGLEDVHYERQPYRNHKVLAEPARHVTRFIALAKVGNPKKKKFLYAFNITPMSQMDQSDLVNQPQDVTECPYKEKSFIAAQSEKQDQFFYDMKEGGGKKRQKEGSGDRQQKKHKPAPTGPCWFCLGSPEVEKHLVVSVGSETYLALAKGGLVDEHILILPIGHYQSSVTAPEDVIEEIENNRVPFFPCIWRVARCLFSPLSNKAPSIKINHFNLLKRSAGLRNEKSTNSGLIWSELYKNHDSNLYKKAIKKCMKKQGKAVVFFERNYRTQHLQIQAVPIPQDSIQDIKDTFMECAESESVELNEIPVHSDIRQIVQVGVPYFYAELPTGEKLYCRISSSKKFPLQFGREVLASPGILDMPERVDWKVCSVSKTQEATMATEFKSKFKKYDFTIED